MTNAARHIERRSIDWIPHAERHGSVVDLGTLWFVGNINLTALATGNLIRTLGEANLALVASGNQGFEPNVGMLLQQAMRGLTSGRQFWRTYILPSAMLVMRDGGMTADKSQTVYNIAPNVVSAHLWGEAFAALVEGAESSQMVKVWTNSPLRLTSFVGDNSEDEFLFPVSAPSASTFATSTKVFVDGVLLSSGVTIASTKITFTVAPAAAKRIDVLRELA
jgi:hypothetical protein